MIARPEPGEFGADYGRYIDRVGGDDLVSALGTPALADLVVGLDAALGAYAYAPGKWTLAQSVQHVIDTERVFGVRALRIARGDTTPLPGYDQDAYAQAAPQRDLADLGAEMGRLRASTLDLFASLSEADLARVGTASGNLLSARAAGWIIAGHDRHHAALTRERYLGAETA